MKSTKKPKEYQLDQDLLSMFSESQSAYLGIIDTRPYTYAEFLSNKLLIVSTIKKGIPYTFFQHVQETTPFTETDWSEFLEISTKSLHRYKSTKGFVFKSIHSEKIIELAEVTWAGLEVFETTDKLKLWLNTPNYALGGYKPFELLKDSYGKELVLAELTRISHGILA